jgi:hypothetical protein
MMKKRNLAIAALAVISLSCAAIGLAACNNGDDSYYNLNESGTIYYEGEQTVKLSVSDTTKNKTTFKDSITKSDITLSGVLAGKTVKDVTYVSSTEISLVVDGEVTANETQADDYGTITVAKSAMANNASANCLARVDFNPELRVVDNSYSIIAGVVDCSSTFELPYGSFNEDNVTTDNIIVPADDVEVITEITTDGNLKITVNNYLSEADDETAINYPVAKISANVTTFNTDLYVYVGTGSSYGIKSTLATSDDGDRLVTEGSTTYTKGIKFTLNSDNASYSVTGYTNGNPAVVIPDTYNGMPVTAIADGVFKDRADIKSVQLGKNIETIGANAFNGCTKLAKVIYSDSNELTGIKTIGEYAFSGAQFTSISLPNVKTVGAFAFNTSTLESVNMPNVETIGDCAFYFNDKLKTVTLSTSITEIPVGLFEFCFRLNTVKGVGELTSIADNAFYDCGIVGLNSDTVIELGNKIESIGNYAFLDCDNIKEFNVNSSKYISKNGVLYEKTSNGLSLLRYPTNSSTTLYEIDEDTIDIQSYAFTNVSNLKAIKIVGKITTISYSAFERCLDLETVLIGNSVETIDDCAFMYCYSLSQIMIGTDEDVAVSKVGRNEFWGCDKLKVIVYSSWTYNWENNVKKVSSWNYKIPSDMRFITLNDDSEDEDSSYKYYSEKILSVFDGSATDDEPFDNFMDGFFLK